MEIIFSPQARAIIKRLKDFDEEDFKRWYLKNLMIGGSNITAYIVDKEREEARHGDIK